MASLFSSNNSKPKKLKKSRKKKENNNPAKPTSTNKESVDQKTMVLALPTIGTTINLPLELFVQHRLSNEFGSLNISSFFCTLNGNHLLMHEKENLAHPFSWKNYSTSRVDPVKNTKHYCFYCDS